MKGEYLKSHLKSGQYQGGGGKEQLNNKVYYFHFFYFHIKHFISLFTLLLKSIKLLLFKKILKSLGECFF